MGSQNSSGVIIEMSFFDIDFDMQLDKRRQENLFRAVFQFWNIAAKIGRGRTSPLIRLECHIFYFSADPGLLLRGLKCLSYVKSLI